VAASPEPLPPPLDLTEPTECDLVMKGGITSGIVYQSAVAELARRYAFRNIGGASAGAIAAAVTAAAEHGRRRDGTAELPAAFHTLAADLKRPGFLAGLFQPAPELRAPFSVLLALATGDRATRPRRSLASVARGWWPVFVLPALVLLAGFVLAAVAGAAIGIVIGVAAILASALLAGALARGSARRIASALDARGQGLCPGSRQPGAPDGQPAVTEWLHDKIQRCAGLPADRPLTFGDLERRAAPNAEPEVTLRIMTTDLSYARGVRLPLERETYLFDEEAMRALFPDAVVDHLCATGRASEHRTPDAARRPLRWMPLYDLPVLVAARMSLTYPLLLSLVPLWTLTEDGRPVRNWFGDGGISSNFPIHLFDAWMPRRPTFGLSFDPFPLDASGEPDLRAPAVVMPASPDERALPYWHPLRGFVGYGARIEDSMKNWRDTTLSELRSFRERICHIRMAPGEGGMNLTMDVAVIEALLERGTLAGRAIVERFSWHKHLLERYETLMGLVQPNLENTAGKLSALGWLAALLAAAGADRDPAWQERAQEETDALLGLARAWHADRFAFRPPSEGDPGAALRIAPET
jgi:predicted acylesterase/phospholipase RssA